MADLEDRIAAIETAQKKDDETFAAIATALDAVSGRLDSAEKTIAAIGDAVKNLSVADTSPAIAEIKTAVNAFYDRVFGDVLFAVPAPETPAV